MAAGRQTKTKAQVKAERAAEIDKEYEQALELLRKRVREGKPLSAWEPLLSATTIRNMCEGNSVKPMQKRRLAWVMAGGMSGDVYRAIANALGQATDIGQWVARLSGDYYYFRQDNPASKKLSEGRVSIRDSGGDCILFRHWSPEWRGPEAEHDGYAFLVDNKLYMLAWKQNVLRLGIAYCPEDHGGVMSGYVLSVQSGGKHPIFTAPSVLIHSSNETELARFRSKDQHIHFLEKHDDHQEGYMPSVSHR